MGAWTYVQPRTQTAVGGYHRYIFLFLVYLVLFEHFHRHAFEKKYAHYGILPSISAKINKEPEDLVYREENIVYHISCTLVSVLTLK
jgi:hypothetical protein